MMTYGELNLKKLRERCGLDFAHYTYIKGMCSCCYGPADLPAKYWRDNKVIPDTDPRYNDIHYILFKNANNGSGEVRSNDTICYPSKQQKKWGCVFGYYPVCIEWSLTPTQLEQVLKELRRQLDEDYHVIRPKDDMECIQIKLSPSMKPEDWEREVRLDPYRPVEYVVKDLCEAEKAFTCDCDTTGDHYIVFAENERQAREKCEDFTKEGFEISKFYTTDKPGIYY